ncbi:MAG TPA: K+/H+ antiporter subunit F [Rhizobiaceae bacterium]|nr:K+/H+ antiporter subunit F [Rhizobiaceae bacterium]
MISMALGFAIGSFTIGLLMNIWRIVKAPSTGDRVLALDTMVINGIALIVLYGIFQNTTVYFEVSLVIAMVGFVSTVAYARYVLRGNLIE